MDGAELGRASARLDGMTRRSVVLAAIGLALVLLLAACRGAGSGQTVSLDGMWILESGANAGAAIPLVPGRDVTLVIDGDTVSGRACNHYAGTISISGNHVTLGELAMTEMACDEPMMSTEAAYHAALAAVDSAARSGDALTLSGPDVTLRYRFEPPAADMPLIATRWVLETLVDGEVASSTLGEPATLVLLPDGTATGSTGCRSFGASYTLDADRLTLTDLSIEKRLCTRELTPQDQQVLAVLSGETTATVSGAGLTLSATDGRGLEYRAATGATGPGGGTAGPADTGEPEATPTVADPDPIDRVFPSGKPLPLLPPIVTIDGIAGRAVSWCLPNVCADGAIDAASNPFVASPTHLELPSLVSEVHAWVLESAQSPNVALAVDPNGHIGPLPTGGWQYLVVFVRIGSGGDALYAWSLTP